MNEMHHEPIARPDAQGAAASIMLALAWLGLSWWHPALTYHFGPPLAAAMWPVLLRARLHRPARRTAALAAVSGGFLIAVVALGVAVAAHWLRGPTLIGSGTVPAEEIRLRERMGVARGRAAPPIMVPSR